MKSVLVLFYHHVAPEPDHHSVSVERFEKQMEFIRRSGIKVLSAQEFISWRKGDLILDRDSILITFDDGYFDNWVYAFPILRKFAFPAMLFVVTGWADNGPLRKIDCLNYKHAKHYDIQKKIIMGQSDYYIMRWEELAALEEEGLVSVHSHTHTHGDWWNSSCCKNNMYESLMLDLIKSRKYIKDKMGKESDCLCWPKGVFDINMIEFAKEAGFVHQFSTLKGYNKPNVRKVVRRLCALDADEKWLSKAFERYFNPFFSSGAGYLHQVVQSYRLKKHYGDRLVYRFLPLPVHHLI